MAGLLSFLPGAISGIANIVEGISKQRPAGEVISAGLRGLVGAPSATDFLPDQKEQEKLAQMPMRLIDDHTMQGSVPRSRLKQVPIQLGQEEDLFDILDRLDDLIDEKLLKIIDESERDRLRGEVERMEDQAEEFSEDLGESLSEEIRLKELFLKPDDRRKRRRRRRR